MSAEIPDVKCPYCLQAAVLGGGKWSCTPCKAWVKAHPDSPIHKPMGRLSKDRLRSMHLRAYAAFDHLWRMVSGVEGWPEARARKAAYWWLAEQMGLHRSECQIAFFNEFNTQRVIDICMAVGSKKDVAA